MKKRALWGVGEIILGTFLFGQGIDMVCHDWGFWGGFIPRAMILGGAGLMFQGSNHVAWFVGTFFKTERT